MFLLRAILLSVVLRSCSPESEHEFFDEIGYDEPDVICMCNGQEVDPVEGASAASRGTGSTGGSVMETVLGMTRTFGSIIGLQRGTLSALDRKPRFKRSKTADDESGAQSAQESRTVHCPCGAPLTAASMMSAPATLLQQVVSPIMETMVGPIASELVRIGSSTAFVDGMRAVQTLMQEDTMLGQSMRRVMQGFLGMIMDEFDGFLNGDLDILDDDFAEFDDEKIEGFKPKVKRNKNQTARAAKKVPKVKSRPQSEVKKARKPRKPVKSKILE